MLFFEHLDVLNLIGKLLKVEHKKSGLDLLYAQRNFLEGSSERSTYCLKTYQIYVRFEFSHSPTRHKKTVALTFGVCWKFWLAARTILWEVQCSYPCPLFHALQI